MRDKLTEDVGHTFFINLCVCVTKPPVKQITKYLYVLNIFIFQRALIKTAHYQLEPLDIEPLQSKRFQLKQTN